MPHFDITGWGRQQTSSEVSAPNVPSVPASSMLHPLSW